MKNSYLTACTLIPKGNPNSLSTLDAIIQDYKKRYYNSAFTQIKNFTNVGDFVCGAHNHSYPPPIPPTPVKLHRHSHQRRLYTNDLLAFIVEIDKMIKAGRHKGLTFDELWQRIGSLPHQGIGPVTIYDVTLRISIYYGLSDPVYVYLHSDNGPLKGAKGYFRHKKSTQVNGPTGKVQVSRLHSGCRIDISNFPEMIAAGLDAKHIENLLCIYHDALDKLHKLP